MNDEILTPVETAAVLKTQPRTLESWRYRGVGPAFIRLSGRAIRYRRSDLEKWLIAQRVGEGIESPA
jgi:hypothetical protein